MLNMTLGLSASSTRGARNRVQQNAELVRRQSRREAEGGQKVRVPLGHSKIYALCDAQVSVVGNRILQFTNEVKVREDC